MDNSTRYEYCYLFLNRGIIMHVVKSMDTHKEILSEIIWEIKSKQETLINQHEKPIKLKLVCITPVHGVITSKLRIAITFEEVELGDIVKTFEILPTLHSPTIIPLHDKINTRAILHIIDTLESYITAITDLAEINPKMKSMSDDLKIELFTFGPTECYGDLTFRTYDVENH